MKNKDEILLEQAYHSIYEDNNPFQPASADDIEDRWEQHTHVINQSVQKYIKNGSEGDLDLVHTPIQSLPDGLEVGGNLELNNSEIQSLPRDLKVGGRLNLSFTSIESLPPGLEVGGNLDLSYTSIQSLPADLKVGGKLYLAVASLYRKYTKNEIREMCPGIDGEIYV